MMKNRLAMGVGALAAIVGLFSLLSGFALAQDPQTLQPGQTAGGDVTNRLGEEWTFAACAGDIVTVTMTSAEFDTFLELYAPDGRDPVASDDNSGTGSNAQLAGVELADTGLHTIVAAGSGILDRGPYSLTLTVSGTVDLQGLGASILTDTLPVTGIVSTRLGEEWLFRGCVSQAVTLTMQSDGFTPLLELYNSTDREPLAVGESAAVTSSAQISGFVLPKNDLYAVIAAGQGILDRGPYTLTLVITETATPTPTVTVTATQTAIETAAPAAPVCSVVSASLNLRAGPGTEFAPPIGALLQGAELRPLARNEDASWIEVEVAANGRQGWVSAATQFVACNVELTDLEPGIIPPTPTATNTPTPTATSRPTNTPTPTEDPLSVLPGPTGSVVVIPFAPSATPPADLLAGLPGPAGVVIQSPGGTGDLEGNVYTDPQIVDGTNARDGEPIFRNTFYLEAFAYDPSMPGAYNRSGAGVDRVEFRMFCPNGGEFANTDRVARYCMFGGGEPSCNILRLQNGATIPGSDCRIENGFYDIDIQVFPENNNLDRANWSMTVKLEPPGSNQPEPEPQPEPQQPADLAAQITVTGPGTNGDSFTGALVFQVQANDPNVGSSDGAGIAYVDLVVVGPDGSPVYGKRESTAAYCAFGGGAPCQPWVFADNDNKWPSGTDFTPGQHRLLAEVNAEDGRTTVVDRFVDIQ